jgi:hypothetical protein
VRTIIVETASRFTRDLIVAETGFRRLRDAGITLIAADAPNSFLDDTPTSAFIRQVLAAVQELDKAMIVSKLKGARQRKRATGPFPMLASWRAAVEQCCRPSCLCCSARLFLAPSPSALFAPSESHSRGALFSV